MFGMTPAVLWIVAALALGNAIFAGLWQWTATERDAEREKVVACAARHDAFVAQTRAEGERAERRTAEIIANSVAITEEIKHDYQATLARLRADYQRLRQQPGRDSAGGSVPAVPDATGGAYEIPADAVPLAAACAETTLTLITLQRWVQQQKEKDTVP